MGRGREGDERRRPWEGWGELEVSDEVKRGGVLSEAIITENGAA